MPADPLRIVDLARAAIAEIAPDSPTWHRDMERVIARAQMAAWMAGTAERLNITPDSPLLSERRLSRAERKEITKVIDRQKVYLASFDAARELYSPAQISARMQLYAAAARQTYLMTRWGDWDIDVELLPGSQVCRGNCRCTMSIRDNGNGTGVLTRKLGETDQSCDECIALEGQHPIERREAA